MKPYQWKFRIRISIRKVQLNTTVSEKLRCMEQFLVIMGMLQLLVIIMVVVFLNSYLTHYTTHMKKENPRKRIAKIIMKNVIDDLGVVREDEGCCITQIANLCNKRKVIYYALDFKHKLFETKGTTQKQPTKVNLYMC